MAEQKENNNLLQEKKFFRLHIECGKIATSVTYYISNDMLIKAREWVDFVTYYLHKGHSNERGYMSGFISNERKRANYDVADAFNPIEAKMNKVIPDLLKKIDETNTHISDDGLKKSILKNFLREVAKEKGVIYQYVAKVRYAGLDSKEHSIV